jgi:surface carbohydrate biosynthesis protein (TIGR04326 family)
VTQSTELLLMTPSKHVVIWDQPGEPQVTSATIVYWNEFFSPSLGDNKISLPQYVEDHSDDLRQRFLAFVRKVGETQLVGKSTIEHLRILPGFSYWWMTLFACKRWSTTSNIIEAVRLLALEDILHEIKPIMVSFATERHVVKNILRDWCVRSEVEFQDLSSPRSFLSSHRQSPTFTPGPIRAVWALGRELARRISAPKGISASNQSTDVVFIDFFSRFDTAPAAEGLYLSGFWGNLTAALDDVGQKTFFLHKFVAGTSMPSRKNTHQVLEGLNSKSRTQQHYLLDAQLSAGVVIKAGLIYFRLLWARFRIRKIKHSFSTPGSELDLWKLFKKEWFDSLSGSTAILHSLTISELDSTIVKIPTCRKVLYLMENQPWEMAFIQIWNHRRSELLIGVPHSSIRYWDLRYFSDPDQYRCDPSARHPIPNTVAVNGPAALISLNATGIPSEQIIEVEALSYLYLEDVQPTISASKLHTTTTRLLVLGDFFDYQNAALLTMLQESLILTVRQISVTVKPHPQCPIDRQDFPHLHFQIDTRPLAEQLNECDRVLATNGTSASVEAYQCGVPVITILNGETFNFSPLRDVRGGIFVESPEHLAHVLDSVEQQDQVPRSDYFLIDKSLKRWKHLLSI